MHYDLHTGIRIELQSSNSTGNREQFVAKLRDLHDITMIALDKIRQQNANNKKKLEYTVFINGEGRVSRVESNGAFGQLVKTWHGDGITYSKEVFRNKANAVRARYAYSEYGVLRHRGDPETLEGYIAELCDIQTAHLGEEESSSDEDSLF